MIDYTTYTDKELRDLIDPEINKGGIPFTAVREAYKRWPEEYITETKDSEHGTMTTS